MAPTHPLLHAHLSEITIDRIRALVRQVGPESPVVEYKEQFTQTIAKGVAAMANTYGGLMLIGVTDKRDVKGVKEKAIESIVEHCNSKIEPPYVPEIVPVPLGQSSELYVLVLRVVPGTYTRPLLVDGVAWVRHQNTSHPADWARLRDLFAENAAGQYQNDAWNVTAPQMPSKAAGGLDESVDFVLRSGLTVAMAPDATWRPLAESAVTAYITALQNSLLARELADLVTSEAASASISRFQHKGFNRSRTVRLEWSGAPSGWTNHQNPAVEACARLEVPGAYGQPGTHLRVEIDLGVRFSAATDGLRQATCTWRVPIHQLRLLIDAMIATLSSKEVIEPVAGLAGVDPIAVPQPRALHMGTARPITEVLDIGGLRLIPDAGMSRGAHLLANPALDLATVDDRSAQVKDWLVQIALDAGLLGMQQVLEGSADARSRHGLSGLRRGD
ncbi:ATP-binding protein [Micromonospora sp. NPDC049891]|uniref:AlbA family DNA-binding domain-containing protein n=1 Tax=Micromonospora sp. NPDC049891 TaxID=3155655 RepID=UPI00340F9165